MTEESTVLADEEVEAPVETEQMEAEAVEAEAETDEEEAEAPEDGEEEQEPEYDEFDFGGNKMQLPKGSVPDELREKIEQFTKGTWGDYTRKSQEIAERAQSIEAREKAVETMMSLNDETQKTYSKGLQVKEEIEQLSQVDINALWQSDPDQARRVSDRLAQKQAEFQNIVARVSQQEQQLTQAQQAELARRADEGRQAVEKRIKGFSEKDLVDYAVSVGIPKEEAAQWSLNPTVAEAFWKARMFDAMQSKTKPAPKPAPKPLTAMKGKGGKGQRDVSEMTPGEMARHLGLPG